MMTLEDPFRGRRSADADESDWIEALRAGDADAFETLVRTHGGRLLAVARRILGDEADAADALQDGLLQAFRNMGAFEGKARLGTWLHRIVVNAALMKLRARRRVREQSIEDLLPRFAEDGHREEPGAPWVDPADDALDRDEIRRLVRTSIDRLPEPYRIVLLLRDIEGYDTAETAAALGLNPGLVKTRLHRARQALRQLLDPAMREA